MCEDMAVAGRSLDADVVEQLRGRLADLRASESVHDLLVGSPTLGEAPDPLVTVNLTRGWVIVASPNMRQLPSDRSGRVDWSRVHRLQIKRIARAEDD